MDLEGLAQLNTDGTAVAVTLEVVQPTPSSPSSPSSPLSPSEPAGPLPLTGGPIDMLVVIAVLMILAGLLVLALIRRPMELTRA